jgi:hypothetical protein
VGQAKRRHVLRYLAARERAGIIGTGPFDLEEALVRLDARMAAGCRWALAVAVEVARAGQQPGCVQCEGFKSLAALDEARPGSVPADLLALPSASGPCQHCDGTGHNVHAEASWPAWLRRKGGEFAAARLAPMREHIRPHWATRGFEATCENEGQRRVETRTRSFPRGAHGSRDPWIGYDLITVRNVVKRPADLTGHLPSWLLGQRRHAEQRRERAQRSAGKAERARRLSHEGRWDPERTPQAMRQQAVEDLLRGSLTTARAATASDPAEQTRLAVEAARLYAAGALGVGAGSEMLEQAAGHNGEVVIVAADERHVAGLRRYVEGIGADHVQVMSVAAVVAGGLRGWSPLVLWDHYALERFPGVDPALYSRDAVAG